MPNRRHRARRLVSALAAACLCMCAACTLQPPYLPPPVPAPSAWSRALAVSGLASADNPSWWTALGDSAIDELVPFALAGSPGVAEAVARVDAARAALDAASAQGKPSLNLAAGIGRARVQDGAAATFATASLGLSWEIDLFGRVRNTVAAARHLLDADTALAGLARLSLQAGVTDAVLGLRGCLRERDVLADTIASLDTTLAITLRRLKAGAIAPVDLARGRAAHASARTALALREQQCGLRLNHLAVLTGREGWTLLPMVAADNADYADNAEKADKADKADRRAPSVSALPAALPPGLPAAVLARHPLVLAAHAELAAAWAQTGVARAQRYPRLDLGAALSGEWLRAGGKTAGDSAWQAGPGLALPLFDGGRAAAGVAASEARYRAAHARLTATVRASARDVENALGASVSATQRIDSARDALQAARTMFDATEAQWRAGAVSLFILEDARRQFSAARLDAIAARQDAGQAWVALILACGHTNITPERPPHETL